MDFDQQIQKAIGAHGLWKGRLLSVIECGRIDAAPADIRSDDKCDFGKWLVSPMIAEAVKATDNYCTCKALHARFHVVAAEVVEHALAGRKAEAQAMMALSGSYHAASAELVRALMAWKRDVNTQRVYAKSENLS
ncbi:MAG: hypothetical protein E6R12_07260 [Sphingomonadales bacterium]|nr:MAG: hypothetical protein E6R12_07260 [Sphingomonadales bacterium]